MKMPKSGVAYTKVFSSDDEISSDDFDSDSDDFRNHTDTASVRQISRNTYKTGLYSALGLSDDDVSRLKCENTPKCDSVASTHSHKCTAGTSRVPVEVIVFDDPTKRRKVNCVLFHYLDIFVKSFS